jgi:SAM-dependent methyltransferase
LNCEIDELYAQRFSAEDLDRREALWSVLARQFFSRYLPADGTAIDVGAGDGLFLRHLPAGRRIAVDPNPRIPGLEGTGIELRVAPAHDFAKGLEGCAHLVLVSNLLEHLPTKAMVVEVLRECRRTLRPDGRLVVLQPNVKYAGGAYWDYLDHELPLTEKSVSEALRLAGCEVLEERARFLPYTVKSVRGMPASWVGPMVSLYLRVPLLWRVFGAQSLVVARSRA